MREVGVDAEADAEETWGPVSDREAEASADAEALRKNPNGVPLDPALPFQDMLLTTEADKPLYFGVTGHRPQKMTTEQSDWGMGKVEYTLDYLKNWARSEHGRGVVLVTGMAMGFDQLAASSALRLSIPVFAVVPFTGQENEWYASHQQTYNAILSACWRVVRLQPEVPWNKKKITQALFQRNTWMAEYVARRQGVAMGLWNGGPGGTAHGVMEFRRRGVPMFLCNPVTRGMNVDPTWPGMQKKEDI